MTDNYTPTTDEVRFAWADRANKHDQEGSDEFDRWLAGVWERAMRDGAAWASGHLTAPPANPFRRDATKVAAFDGTRDSSDMFVRFGDGEYLVYTCNLCGDGTTVAGPSLRFHLLTKHPEADR